MFETIVPLLDLSFIFGIITTGLLNFVDGLSLSITKTWFNISARYVRSFYVCILGVTVGKQHFHTCTGKVTSSLAQRFFALGVFILAGKNSRLLFERIFFACNGLAMKLWKMFASWKYAQLSNRYVQSVDRKDKIYVYQDWISIVLYFFNLRNTVKREMYIKYMQW